MPFPPAFLDELAARNPIEEVVGQYVNLKRSGSNLFGLCPFHGEKTPSFSVAPDKGIYYCFGCHKGGGVINFEMEIEGLSYPDAVRALAQRVGMEVPDDEEYQSRYRKQERLWALSKEAARLKNYDEPLCGEFDGIVVPSLLAGNLIVKCWQMHAKAKTCGVVVGAKVPVALTSRSDDKEVSFLSLAFCAAMGTTV